MCSQSNVEDVVDGILGDMDYFYNFMDVYIGITLEKGMDCFDVEYLRDLIVKVGSSRKARRGNVFPPLALLESGAGCREFQLWAERMAAGQRKEKLEQFGLLLKPFLELNRIDDMDLSVFGFETDSDSSYAPEESVDTTSATMRYTRADTLRMLSLMQTYFLRVCVM